MCTYATGLGCLYKYDGGLGVAYDEILLEGCLTVIHFCDGAWSLQG